MIEEAKERLSGVVSHTPLVYSERLSREYDAEVYLKREDLQVVRSYKIRGAYNKVAMLALGDEREVVCASAGNHAQGVAFACAKLGRHGRIYMPKNTPEQKVNRVRYWGADFVNIVLEGDTYDDACISAQKYCVENNGIFVHPFDDVDVMAGQGTLALEILDDLKKKIDFFVVPVGGGGLLAGAGFCIKTKSPETVVVGVEPSGAPSMTEALCVSKPVTLSSIDKFVDGASVKTVGKNVFPIAQKILDQMLLVKESRVCDEMISFYQNEGIVAEPAGALASASLDQIRDEIKGKIVVCVLSGGNNDLKRYPEILARSMSYNV